MHIIKKHHYISTGHKVTGHKGKCKNLHGHNYKITLFFKTNKLNDLGFVFDFSEYKKLFEWIDNKFDHKFLIYKADKKAIDLYNLFSQSVVLTNFNPTAENLSKYILIELNKLNLIKNHIIFKCEIQETNKCIVTFEVNNEK